MAIRVLVNGARGRMGQHVVAAVRGDEALELAGEADLGDDLAGAIAAARAQVVVDFTVPDTAVACARTILDAGAHPVIGTTGFTPDDIAGLQALARERGVGGLIAPNFAIGAVLMMRLAAEAARHLPHVEIIEMHHDGKAEAPSGTAIKTAELIAAARPQRPALQAQGRELSPGALGAQGYAVPIHSVRLPGYVAHQEVILGGPAQTLTIRHDSVSRESFMPGVVLACKRVVGSTELLYGLEHLL